MKRALKVATANNGACHCEVASIAQFLFYRQPAVRQHRPSDAALAWATHKRFLHRVCTETICFSSVLYQNDNLRMLFNMFLTLTRRSVIWSAQTNRGWQFSAQFTPPNQSSTRKNASSNMASAGLLIQMPGPRKRQRKFRSPEFPISRTF